MLSNWEKIRSRLRGDYTVFRVREDVLHAPHNGREATFYVLESADWVNVIPLTPAGEVVLIRQYRPGSEAVMLEIPGGMIDDEDRDPAVAAARELREETGYAAEAMIYLGEVTPNPALFNNRCLTYLAQNAYPAGPPELDGNEYITTERVPLADIPQLIRRGDISHALVIAAFYHLQNYQARPG